MTFGTSRPRRVLVVEDDESLARVFVRALERDGYGVSSCSAGSSALELLESWTPDLIVLDLGLPDGSGFELLRAIRERSGVPVIVASGRGDETDRVRGLTSGADDYLVKPVSMPELVARVTAVLRRADAPREVSSKLRTRDVELDAAAHTVHRAGEPISLTPKEFELLRMLMAAGGNLVRRADILRAIWNGSQGAVRSLEVHVSALRRKLGDDVAEPRYIETVTGLGYRFAPAPQQDETP